MKSRGPFLVAFIALFTGLASLAFLRNADPFEWQNLALWIRNSELEGAFVFIVLYVGATLLFLPVMGLNIAAGVIYEWRIGVPLVVVSSALSAALSFILGRYATRPWIEKKIRHFPKIRKIDEAVQEQGWKIVALSRLGAILPFTLLNYSLGVTRLHLGEYLAATVIAMLPGIAVHVYLGSVAEDLAAAFSGSAPHNSFEWGVAVSSTLASVALGIYLTYIAKQALHKRHIDV